MTSHQQARIHYLEPPNLMDLKDSDPFDLHPLPPPSHDHGHQLHSAFSSDQFHFNPLTANAIDEHYHQDHTDGDEVLANNIVVDGDGFVSPSRIHPHHLPPTRPTTTTASTTSSDTSHLYHPRLDSFASSSSTDLGEPETETETDDSSLKCFRMVPMDPAEYELNKYQTQAKNLEEEVDTALAELIPSQLKHVLQKLQSITKDETLTHELDSCFSSSSIHLTTLIQQVESTLKQLQIEADVEAVLKNAIHRGDVDAVQSSIAKAELVIKQRESNIPHSPKPSHRPTLSFSMKPFTPKRYPLDDVLIAATSDLTRLNRLRECRTQLKSLRLDATEDEAHLSSLLKTADEVGLPKEETLPVRQRLCEIQTRSQLQQAMKLKDVKELDHAISNVEQRLAKNDIDPNIKRFQDTLTAAKQSLQLLRTLQQLKKAAKHYEMSIEDGDDAHADIEDENGQILSAGTVRDTFNRTYSQAMMGGATDADLAPYEKLIHQIRRDIFFNPGAYKKSLPQAEVVPKSAAAPTFDRAAALPPPVLPDLSPLHPAAPVKETISESTTTVPKRKSSNADMDLPPPLTLGLIEPLSGDPTSLNHEYSSTSPLPPSTLAATQPLYVMHAPKSRSILTSGSKQPFPHLSRGLTIVRYPTLDDPIAESVQREHQRRMSLAQQQAAKERLERECREQDALVEQLRQAHGEQELKPRVKPPRPPKNHQNLLNSTKTNTTTSSLYPSLTAASTSSTSSTPSAPSSNENASASSSSGLYPILTSDSLPEPIVHQGPRWSVNLMEMEAPTKKTTPPITQSTQTTKSAPPPSSSAAPSSSSSPPSIPIESRQPISSPPNADTSHQGEGTVGCSGKCVIL